MDAWLAEHLLNSIITRLAETVLGALDALWGLLTATVFVNPDVTELPQVTAFAGRSLGIVNVCYVLALLWAAIQVMGRDTIQSTVGPGELIPRLIIGLIAANFAMPICSMAIQLANALTAALTGQDITAPDSMRQIQALTVAALNNRSGASPAGLLLLLIGLLIAVLVGGLVVQWIMRLGLLIVLAGIAPIALALHGTPQSEGAAKLWWRILLGCLATVTVQAVALHTTLAIFLNPDANLPIFGLPGDPGAVLSLLIVVCLLWGVLKVPGLMRRFVTQSKPSAFGTVLRVVVVQQLTRQLRRGLALGRPSMRARQGGVGAAQSGPATRPWPVVSGNARSRTASHGPRYGNHTARPVPRPAGAGAGRVGGAYPTRRSLRPYTRQELAQGVDLYTRAMKARAGAPPREAP